jgi:CheY-like chemotaxis protein
MTDIQAKDEVTILIAEDDDGHAELIKEHLRSVGLYNEMKRFRDGIELWEFLSTTEGDNCRKKDHSYLLLLDIRMPRLNGVEVLRKIKSDTELHKMPVIMLTTTDDPREIEECYRLGCSSYITKPIDFIQFADTLKRLGLFIMVVKVAKLDE